MQREHERRDRLLADTEAEFRRRCRESVVLDAEWEQEMAALRCRRASMSPEELERDCLQHFATIGYLHKAETCAAGVRAEDAGRCPPFVGSGAASSGEVPIGRSDTPLVPGMCEHDRRSTDCCPGSSSSSALAAVALPVGRDAETPPRQAPLSIGELSKAEFVATAAALACALSEAAAALERGDAEVALSSPGSSGRDGSASNADANADEDFERRLDGVVGRFAAGGGTCSWETGAAAGAAAAPLSARRDDGAAASSVAAGADLSAKVVRLRTAARRVAAVPHAVAEDFASARVSVALAALGAGLPAGLPTGGGKDHRAFSTADACWALSAQRQHWEGGCLRCTTMDELAAHCDGCWSWEVLRQTAVGWWLHGPDGAKQLDVIVLKVAQCMLARLRTACSGEASGVADDATPRFGSDASARLSGPGCASGASRGQRDEAFFWCVASGARTARLRQLLRAGAWGQEPEPALEALLQNEGMEDPGWLRRNAFRLLQLHRYHLASALFHLSDEIAGGGEGDAPRVVAAHLGDLQLALVLSRGRPEAVAPLLRGELDSSPLVCRDAWLHFLLAWRLGDIARAKLCAAAAKSSEVDAVAAQQQQPRALSLATDERRPQRQRERDGSPALFDGVLQLSLDPTGLEEFARVLVGEECSPAAARRGGGYALGGA